MLGAPKVDYWVSYPFPTPHICLLTCHSEDCSGQRTRPNICRASRDTSFLSALCRSGPWHRLLMPRRGQLEFRRQSDPLGNLRSSQLPGRPAGGRDSLASTQAVQRGKQWSSGRHGDLLGSSHRGPGRQVERIQVGLALGRVWWWWEHGPHQFTGARDGRGN